MSAPSRLEVAVSKRMRTHLVSVSKITLVFLAAVALASPAFSADTCADFFEQKSSTGEALVPRTNDVLREKASAVSRDDFESGAITETLNQMLDIYDQTGALGIAAPQIGVSKQILMAKIRLADVARFEDRTDLLVMINPVVKPVGAKQTLMMEGCLSLGSTCAIVPRSRKIAVEFDDIAGKKHEIVFSGFSARIIQHEVDHLHGILFTDRASSLAELLKLRPARTVEQRALLSDIKANLSGLNLGDRFQWRSIFSRTVDNISNPYSFAYDLKTASDLAGKTITGELKELSKIIAMDNHTDQAVAFSRWVKSDAHALFLYDLLHQRGLQKYSEAAALLAENPYFGDAHRERGPPFSFLAYSFEKEGQKPEISDFYKVPGIEDNKWFKKPADERLQLLKKRAVIKKSFLSASTIAPTDLKPSFLSGFSLELTNALHPVRSWEISHKRYELSLKKMMGEVKDLAHYFDETHSFQVHTTFELPRAYHYYANFRLWLKSLNDFLYLRGLEESLHGNELANVMQLPEDSTFSERLKESDSQLQTLRASDVKLQSDKMFSGGLRGQIYGLASSVKFVKLGIELRDVTRNVDTLEHIMENLSDSLAARVWEKKALPTNGELPRLSTNRKRTRAMLLESGIKEEFVDRFITAEPTVVIGLEKFENGRSYNYKTEQFETADDLTTQRLALARTSYVRKLLNIQTELVDFKLKKGKVTKAEIQLAIRQSLTEWAKLARPSERYSY